MQDSVLQAGDSLLSVMPAPGHRAHRLRVRFTGSGSEYFRIWIVNLLLVLVTLGLYYPWAKVRRLRYFHANTLVGGEALGFHGDPRKMFKGYLLVGVMFILYSVAGNFSATAGFVALLIVAAVWPALFKSSLQFRLANTSWRGLRLAFRGNLPDVYRAVLPLFAPGLLILGALALVDDRNKPPLWYGVTVLVVLLVGAAVMPWLLWNLRQYQHNHYALASLQTTFKASLVSFYALFFKLLGVVLLAGILPLALGVAALLAARPGAAGEQPGPLLAAGLVLGPLLGGLAVLAVAKPYLVARLQNLVWTKTGNRSLRFLSELRFSSLVWLTLKNWLLVVLTLGLYWPFAAVAEARLRLEAVTLKTRDNPDALVQLIRSAEGDASGDAAGDLFGLDIGL